MSHLEGYSSEMYSQLSSQLVQTVSFTLTTYHPAYLFPFTCPDMLLTLDLSRLSYAGGNGEFPSVTYLIALYTCDRKSCTWYIRRSWTYAWTMSTSWCCSLLIFVLLNTCLWQRLTSQPDCSVFPGNNPQDGACNVFYYKVGQSRLLKQMPQGIRGKQGSMHV